jgi:hypothetical protein
VLAARTALVRQLRKQSADVHVLDLPSGEDVGPDDEIAHRCDEAMTRLLDGAADGEKILNDLETFLRRFVIMTDAQFTAVALWIIHT